MLLHWATTAPEARSPSGPGKSQTLLQRHAEGERQQGAPAVVLGETHDGCASAAADRLQRQLSRDKGIKGTQKKILSPNPRTSQNGAPFTVQENLETVTSHVWCWRLQQYETAGSQQAALEMPPKETGRGGLGFRV